MWHFFSLDNLFFSVTFLLCPVYVLLKMNVSHHTQKTFFGILDWNTLHENMFYQPNKEVACTLIGNTISETIHANIRPRYHSFPFWIAFRWFFFGSKWEIYEPFTVHSILMHSERSANVQMFQYLILWVQLGGIWVELNTCVLLKIGLMENLGATGLDGLD